MRNYRSLVSIVLGIALTAIAAATPQNPDVFNHQLMVKFKPGISHTLAHLGIGAEEVSNLAQTGWSVVKIPAATSVSTALTYYRSLSGVSQVNPNYTAYASIVPNDPKYSQQYAPQKVSAPSGWDLTIGSSGVVIAIVDTGLDLLHEEFQGGKVLPGYDYANNDSNPQDDEGHGTHCSGIAAASTNNGIGIAGIGYSCRILPVKVLGANGSGSFANVDKGIMFAADQGANVISMSLGATYPKAFGIPQDLIDAVNYALARGCVVVAAAGNEAVSLDQYLSVPAMVPGVLCVGATDSSDAETVFTNYGSPVKIAAPGLNILSTLPTSQGKYGIESGTSMSTPCVAGAAGLLWSYAPAGTTNTQIVSALTSTSDFVGTWLDGGRLNVYRALNMIGPGVLFTQLADSNVVFTGTLVGGVMDNVKYSDGVTADIRPTFFAGLGYVAAAKVTFTLDHSYDRLKDVTAVITGSALPRASLQVFMRDWSSLSLKYVLMKAVPNSSTATSIDLGRIASKYVSGSNVVEMIVRQLNPTSISISNSATNWQVDQIRLDAKFRV